VTRAQFRRFVGDSGYQTDAERDGKGGYGFIDGQWRQDPRFVWNADLGFEQADDHPVLNVSWNDATAFCAWLSDQRRSTTPPRVARRTLGAVSQTTTLSRRGCIPRPLTMSLGRT